MKRKFFLAGGMAIASGCSRSSTGISALPSAPSETAAVDRVPDASTSSSGGPNTYPFRMTAAVLASPILGEAGIPPSGVTPSANWMRCDGRTLQIAKYPALFAILGKIAGGNGKTTFALPKTKGPYYLAVVGAQPSSPAVLAQWRKGAKAEVGMPAPASPASPAAPVAAFEYPASVAAFVPSPTAISEHARFAQVLAGLSLDAGQIAAIDALTSQARQAPTGAARRAAVEATMATIVTTVLHDDQQSTVRAQMSAWHAARGA